MTLRVMDEKERRLAENEAVFRNVNEHIEDAAAIHGDDDHLYEFICECSNADCTFRVRLSLGDYEEIRAHATRFFVLTGHAMPEVERVIERRDGYDIAEKEGDAAELVERENPR